MSDKIPGEWFPTMLRLTTALVFLSIFLAASGLPVYGAAPFYEGKAIRIIVGTSPGGGYDTYTRLIARHFSKHIPGNPTIVVDNMPGAGGLVSANHLFKVAKPDGLTIGHFVGGQFLQQLLGKPGIEFDALKFEYIGVPAQDNFVFGVAKTTGITNVEQFLAAKTPVKFGAISAGDGTYDTAKVAEVALGLTDSGRVGIQRHRADSPGVQRRRGRRPQQLLAIVSLNVAQGARKR